MEDTRAIPKVKTPQIKYCLYARKSSESDERQAMSIDGQLKEMELVAKRLEIPLEILTFGGDKGFIFLKTHGEELRGDDLKKMVLLKADQGTPDVVTLEAACASMQQFSDRFKSAHNFIYFMTDGQSGSAHRTIQDVIQEYKRDMVMTGIGLGPAANTIQQSWGKNALPVPNVNRLSEQFLDKVEQQVEETFD